MNLGPLIIGIEGLSLGASEQEWLMHPNIGGVILFSRNFESVGQLEELCASIRAIRSPALLISVDQEGGRVQRFKTDFTQLPPLALLGRWYASHPDRACDLAYRHGRVMAAEVIGRGLDWSWAPVLDLGGISEVIGDRAMAKTPEAVIALAKLYLAGMRDAGMACCGKHYPGHGSTQADTHTETVYDPRPLEALMADEAPFVALADELQMVMMAHVIYPAVCSKPAGFSRQWICGRLKNKAGFGGLVVSDDLDMMGAADVGSLQERLSCAFDAGCDLALVCNPKSVPEALKVDWPTPSQAKMEALKAKPLANLDEQSLVSEFRFWRQSLSQLAQDINA